MRRLALTALLLSVAANGQTTQPATQESRFDIQRRESREQFIRRAGNVTPITPVPTTQILDLALEHGRIVPTVKREDLLAGVNLMHSIDPPGEAMFSKLGDDVSNFQFQFLCTDHPAEIERRTQMFFRPGFAQIAQGIDGVAKETNIDFIDRTASPDEPGNVSMVIQVSLKLGENTVVDERLTAADLPTLRRNYHQRTQQYLLPILVEFGFENLLAPEPATAWPVLGEGGNESLRKRIDAILPRMEDDDFRVRKTAAAELEKLGQPAAIELFSMDRTGWSAQRTSEIDSFLANYARVNSADAKTMKLKPEFLFDCLYSRDAAIRSAAIGKLRGIAGIGSIQFDTDSPRDVRVRQLDQIYAQLFKSSPTTSSRPSTK